MQVWLCNTAPVHVSVPNTWTNRAWGELKMVNMSGKNLKNNMKCVMGWFPWCMSCFSSCGFLILAFLAFPSKAVSQRVQREYILKRCFTSSKIKPGWHERIETMTILKQQTNTRTPLENAMSIMSTVSMDQSIKYNQRHGICFKGLRHFLFSSYGFFGFSNFSKCPYSLVSKYHESMFGAQLRLTVPPDLTWNILQTSKSSKVEHSFFKLPWPHHRAQRQLKVSVQPGCRRAWFAAVFLLSRSYANQLQKFSRPHIVNLWNCEGNKMK